MCRTQSLDWRPLDSRERPHSCYADATSAPPRGSQALSEQNLSVSIDADACAPSLRMGNGRGGRDAIGREIACASDDFCEVSRPYQWCAPKEERNASVAGQELLPCSRTRHSSETVAVRIVPLG